jgi:hypothetical protein
VLLVATGAAQVPKGEPLIQRLTKLATYKGISSECFGRVGYVSFEDLTCEETSCLYGISSERLGRVEYVLLKLVTKNKTRYFYECEQTPVFLDLNLH